MQSREFEVAPMSKKVLYTAHTDVTGGRNGHGSSDDGALDLVLRRPVETGGEGGGTNPEQLFGIGYSACFIGALEMAARRLRVDEATEGVSVHADVSLTTNDARGFAIDVALAISMPAAPDSATAHQIVTIAHQICPYSNATRGNIELTMSANGEPVALDDVPALAD